MTEPITREQPYPLVPEGQYQAYLLYWETALVRQFGNTPKVFLHFRLLFGEYAGTPLRACYRVRRINGKPKKWGGFKLARGSELLRQMAQLGAVRRRDRPSLRPLLDTSLKVQVRTVTCNGRGKPLPEVLQYSIVDEMLELEAGSTKS